MPNPPKASANTASHRTDGAGATTETGVKGRSSEMVTDVWTFLLSDSATVTGLSLVCNPT